MAKHDVPDWISAALSTQMKRLGIAEIELQYWPSYGTLRAWGYIRGGRCVQGDVADTLTGALDSLKAYLCRIAAVCPKCGEVIEREAP